MWGCIELKESFPIYLPERLFLRWWRVWDEPFDDVGGYTIVEWCEGCSEEVIRSDYSRECEYMIDYIQNFHSIRRWRLFKLKISLIHLFQEDYFSDEDESETNRSMTSVDTSQLLNDAKAAVKKSTEVIILEDVSIWLIIFKFFIADACDDVSN